ncbi:putative tpa: zn 2cys6 transcription factor protein [Eutypa lata UCREL1]|uniref:Putative tpa: zn 2cys6 transcription factor protein n=1 Tax=Eutypa lata (strain UCR-EL1) TaxID=1287681 RepID=M7SVL0_EUTLA|nr:putative tpa: zn 2cys6 transcription factor protein [Eutypa lata UCREL1]
MDYLRELRHELPDLPPCTLQESQFPFPLPTFPTGLEGTDQGAKPIEPTPLSHYFFLAEVSLRRLLNRARHTASQLSPGIDSVTATHISESIHHLEDQLQQWLECLPPALQFNLPPDLLPSPHEPELVKLMRERYVEAREFLYRVFLYICLHGGDRLTHAQVIAYSAKATAGLRLSVYRIQTEKPFFRHMGSWIACRVRFNQALCLVAAARGKELGMESARYVLVPPAWRECVGAVRDRLEIWSDEGAGIPELTTLLNWLLE